jgi:hypothetical protein
MFCPRQKLISRTFKIRGTLLFFCPTKRERARARARAREGNGKGKIKGQGKGKEQGKGQGKGQGKREIERKYESTGDFILYVPQAYILHLLESCRFSKCICFPGRF